LAIFSWPPTPFGKSSNINHNVSRGVACRPEVSRGVPWKVEGWVEGVGMLRASSRVDQDVYQMGEVYARS